MKKMIDGDHCEIQFGSIDAAREMIKMIAKSLPEEVWKLNALFLEKNYPALLKQAHYFHGSACYSGSPELRGSIHDLEIFLREHIKSPDSETLAQLLAAVDRNAKRYLAEAEEF